MLVRVNRSKSVDDFAAAVGVSHGTWKFWLMTWTCRVLPSTVYHASWRKTDVMDAWRFLVTWWWYDVYQPDHNWRRNMVLPLRSSTEATIHHLENVRIATTEKTAATQVKSKVMLELFLFKWNCSHGIHPRRCNCKQNPLKEIFGRLRDSVLRKRPELWRRNILAVATRQRTCTTLCPCTWGTCKAIVHLFLHPPYTPDLAPCGQRRLFWGRM